MRNSEDQLLRLVHWKMMSRCYNVNDAKFPTYGGRGITVCDRWRTSRAAFLADMGPRPSRDHSIERIDNAGPYSPENCRWATRREQGANKRNNHLLTYQGRTQHLNGWAREFNLPRTRLTVRLRRGWTLEQDPRV